MRTPSALRRFESGSTLAIVLVVGGIMGIVIAAMLGLSSFSLRSAHGRSDWNAAFFHAENAVQWAAQGIADANPAGGSNYYSTAAGTLTLGYAAAAKADPGSGFRNSWVKVIRYNPNLPNNYQVIASARVNDKVRTVQGIIRKNPPSHVFDYEYFLNNWGWWWGSSIQGQGGNRANWDFDFRGNPTVNGELLANGSVTQNGTVVDPFTGSPPFNGVAGSDPLSYVHSGVPREVMPNLKDFSTYQAKAMAGAATNGIWVGTNRVVAGVQNNAVKPGLYIVGTATQPIKIVGTVVVPGDVVIKGRITGQGTLYVGGNLYVAGDLTYNNPPNWGVFPETLSPAQRDAWVLANKDKDLIGFAVRESIFAGDVNSTEWQDGCFNPSPYGLKWVGDEANLGPDGIPHTGDDGMPFDHFDGTAPSAWYDADGDGVKDGNFNYNAQITMTGARALKILGYPTTGSAPDGFNTVASNNMNLLDGIFYTNHAAAMRLMKANALFHGVVVSRDEAIRFSGTLNFIYDSRVHSRYSNDPNRYIDLGLPIAGVLAMSRFTELAPDPAGL